MDELKKKPVRQETVPPVTKRQEGPFTIYNVSGRAKTLDEMDEEERRPEEEKRRHNEENLERLREDQLPWFKISALRARLRRDDVVIVDYITKSKEWLTPKKYRSYLERVLEEFEDWRNRKEHPNDGPLHEMMDSRYEDNLRVWDQLKEELDSLDQGKEEHTPGVHCILWKEAPGKLELLAGLLARHECIDSSSAWLQHFSTNALERTEAEPIKWKRTRYEIQYLLRNLGLYMEIRPNLESHFEGVKNLGGGSHAYHKLDIIKKIHAQVLHA